ncbi:SDR family NAD(P)-dependent oxidoreductase [Micromonospora musae]|uniref:SDR family NAD(P)-dependent oxidoreductase n=1 Tax=Micromonospora musae TaxID=1894970 RepID=A0ABX9R4P3_9ACTN|nr:SDR family NAD(P)-dependent oxidoreductase [Micromonospora musae]RKN18137.1 SDR family NAD(P)-dependent oxidoreductase [Micromonospora musae]
MVSSTVALVTGANKGLGFETARQLGQRGVAVLLGSRDPGRGEAAAAALREEGLDVTAVTLDVTDAAAVRALADRLRAEHGRLDILVNNAGSIDETPILDVSAEQMRRTFETNVFAVTEVTHAMLPLLRASTAGRIVNVASTTASFALTGEIDSPYAAAEHILPYSSSKAALNMVTVRYAQAFHRTPGYEHLKINSASPGHVATDLTHHGSSRTAAEGARIIVHLATLPADGPSGGYLSDAGQQPW